MRHRFTACKDPAVRVRFCHASTDESDWVGGWSIDDLSIGPPYCPSIAVQTARQKKTATTVIVCAVGSFTVEPRVEKPKRSTIRMRNRSVISRLSLSTFGLALIGLFVPACDSGTAERSLSEQEDCGCEPEPTPDDEPGECGPDGPQPECHDLFHFCLEYGGTKDECLPLLDVCEPPPPEDDCFTIFEGCLETGGTKEDCSFLLLENGGTCQPPASGDDCFAPFNLCTRSGYSMNECAVLLNQCLPPQHDCYTSWNLCVEGGGHPDECAFLLEVCQPQPVDACLLILDLCLENGGTKEECGVPFYACHAVAPLPGDCFVNFNLCIESGGTKDGCYNQFDQCLPPPPGDDCNFNFNVCIAYGGINEDCSYLFEPCLRLEPDRIGSA